MPNWQKRYLLLSTCNLYWFVSPARAEILSEQKHIELRNIKEVKCVDDTGKFNVLFTRGSTEKSLFLKAADKGSAELWVRKIRLFKRSRTECLVIFFFSLFFYHVDCKRVNKLQRVAGSPSVVLLRREQAGRVMRVHRHHREATKAKQHRHRRQVQKQERRRRRQVQEQAQERRRRRQVQEKAQERRRRRQVQEQAQERRRRRQVQGTKRSRQGMKRS
jgi:flagellar biosynthesis GTPase FlhF